jgi:hypothetical protein
MAQFPVSKPFPRNVSAEEFVRRIEEVGWAPCTAEQLVGYAHEELECILPLGEAKTAVGLRKAKAKAVEEWFETMDLPEARITQAHFREHSPEDRWVTGLGLDCSSDDMLGIIAIGAIDLRTDGSFEMTTVDCHALVERWDSRVGGPVLQRLLFNTAPLEVVQAVFTKDGSLLVAGFYPRVFRLNARTLGDAHELTAISDLKTCPHGPHDDSDADEESELRILELRGTSNGTLARNCCDEWFLLPNDGRGASQFMTITGTVCFPPDGHYTETEWCITTDEVGQATIYHLPDGDIVGTFRATGGKIIDAVMPDTHTLVTRSVDGHVQWWTMPTNKPSRGTVMLSAHIDLPADARFLACLEALGTGSPYVIISTRSRRLMLLEPHSGAVHSDIEWYMPVDRAVRSGPNHAIIWDTPEEPFYFQLNPLKCVWLDGIVMTDAPEPVAVLPDGRLVRAAFGVIVEDPTTGDVLEDYRLAR